MRKYTSNDLDNACEDFIDGLGVSIHKSIEESLGFKKLKDMVEYASSVLKKIEELKSQTEKHRNECLDCGLSMSAKIDDSKLKMLEDITKGS